MSETQTGTGARTRSTREAQISAPPGQPVIEIVREFDAPVERVFRAHVDPELVVQWLGPRRLTMRLEQWDMRRGGSYRYVHVDEDGTEYGFWGAVHDVQPGRSITQTFGFDPEPDSPTFDRAEFTDLGDGRTRLRVLSVTHDVATRDAFLSSGMEGGMQESYERLDGLLAGSTEAS
jgi:uncharacterized protein YndB with AHSA1/START domain